MLQFQLAMQKVKAAAWDQPTSRYQFGALLNLNATESSVEATAAAKDSYADQN